MIKVKVPATSANVGSGFDCAGIALDLYNEVYFEQSDKIDIKSLDGTEIPEDESNLVFQSVRQLYEISGEDFKGLAIRQINRIPMTRGLGSSSACIVAGLLAANAMLGSRYSKKKLLNIASDIEGHPDNVAPAFLGGFSASVIDAADGVQSARFDIENDIDFAAFIPPFELKTSDARDAIPKVIPHEDAVYNLSRSALLTAAFAHCNYHLLKYAVGDRLHQQYRIGMIRGGEEVFDIAGRLSAYATYISGAGSTIMAIVPPGDADFRHLVSSEIKRSEKTADYEIVWLKADNKGAVLEEIEGNIHDL